MKSEIPNNLEAEKGILACMIIEGGDHFNWLMDMGVSAAYFHDHVNRAIFSGCVALDAKGISPTYDNLLAHFYAVGGLSSDIMGRLSEAFSAGGNEQTRRLLFPALQDAFLRRQVLGRIWELEEQLASGQGEAAEAVSAHVERLSGMIAGKDPRTWREAVKEAEEAIRNDMLPPSQRKSRGEISWGFPILDRAFCKMEPGELVTIAARTSCGKSSLARQVWLNAARESVPCLLHTLEVSDSELARNLAANLSGVRSRKELHRLHQDDQRKLLDACAELGSLNVAEVRCREPKLAQMLSAARAFKRRHGLKLWVIDYLGLVWDAKNPQKGETMAAAIGRVTSELKRFASEEQVVVVMLVQIGRSGEDPAHDISGEGPSLVHLKDSGCIEEDSNRVLIIHRPKAYQETDDGAMITQNLKSTAEEEPTFYCIVTQAKGRNHGTGRIGMMFDRMTASFRQTRG